jgi:hypothetical protein
VRLQINDLVLRLVDRGGNVVEDVPEGVEVLLAYMGDPKPFKRLDVAAGPLEGGLIKLPVWKYKVKETRSGAEAQRTLSFVLRVAGEKLDGPAL